MLVIGEGAVVENRYDSSIFSDLHVLNFLGEMNDRSESLDETFITPLKNVFHASKYTRLCQHFTLFKEAHLNPIFGTLISDKNLLNLVLGTIRLKIGEDLSLSEALTWRRHHEIIINYLEPCLAMPGDNIDDYEDSIALAFGKSALHLNFDVLNQEDCKRFNESLFSKPLIKILSEHFSMIAAAYSIFISQY